jgi:hypothetical protein
MTRALEGILGARTLFAFQRVVKVAKITALLSAVWTILCAMMIVGFQVIFWLRNDVWDTYRISSVIKSLEGDRTITYVTASSDKFEAEWTINRVIAEWLLGVPAIVPLLIVAALQVAFCLRLAAIDKDASTN